MDRGVGVTPLACNARNHASLVDGRVLRIRCRDSRCRDVIDARNRGLGEKVIHCWDTQNIANGWTELEAPTERTKEN